MASVEEALKLGTDLFGTLTTTSALPTINDVVTFPSPVKDALAGTISPENHPRYECDWKDDNGRHWIQFKRVTTTYTVSVARNDLLEVLNLGPAVNGELVGKPTWVSGTSRSDFVKCQFAGNKPDHFFPKPTHDPIHNLKNASGKKIGKQGGKHKAHPYFVTVVGVCEGQVDGCQAKFLAGMKESDLSALASGTTSAIPFYLHIAGDPCTHIWKKKYVCVCVTGLKRFGILRALPT